MKCNWPAGIRKWLPFRTVTIDGFSRYPLDAGFVSLRKTGYQNAHKSGCFFSAAVTAKSQRSQRLNRQAWVCSLTFSSTSRMAAGATVPLMGFPGNPSILIRALM
jgi:hypothetical protein